MTFNEELLTQSVNVRKRVIVDELLHLKLPNHGKLFRALLMSLPKELERDFRNEVERIEEERRMRYVTSIERLAKEEGLEQGLEKGLVQGQLKVLKRLLTRRFGDLPGRSLALLEKAGPEDLERWSDRVLDAKSLDEVFSTP